MLVILIALLAWLSLVACCAALCSIASRGDEDQDGAGNLEEWARVAAFARPGDGVGAAPLARPLRGRSMSLARPLRRRAMRPD